MLIWTIDADPLTSVLVKLVLEPRAAGLKQACSTLLECANVCPQVSKYVFPGKDHFSASTSQSVSIARAVEKLTYRNSASLLELHPSNMDIQTPSLPFAGHVNA